jgi:hypothetical protein
MCWQNFDRPLNPRTGLGTGISRVEIPAENFKRMISRTWRISINYRKGHF